MQAVPADRAPADRAAELGTCVQQHPHRRYRIPESTAVVTTDQKERRWCKEIMHAMRIKALYTARCISCCAGTSRRDHALLSVTDSVRPVVPISTCLGRAGKAQLASPHAARHSAVHSSCTAAPTRGSITRSREPSETIQHSADSHSAATVLSSPSPAPGWRSMPLVYSPVRPINCNAEPRSLRRPARLPQVRPRTSFINVPSRLSLRWGNDRNQISSSSRHQGAIVVHSAAVAPTSTIIVGVAIPSARVISARVRLARSSRS